MVPRFVGPGGFVGVTVGLVAGFVAVVLAEVGLDGFVGVTVGLVVGFCGRCFGRSRARRLCRCD